METTHLLVSGSDSGSIMADVHGSYGHKSDRNPLSVLWDATHLRDEPDLYRVYQYEYWPQ